MQVCGLGFTNSIIEDIAEIVKAKPSISRRELSRRLCENNDWRSPNGSLKEMGCRKALAELDRRGAILLPAVSASFGFEQRREGDRIEVPQLTCSLEELGEVIARPVTSRYGKDARLWRALMDSYHYLGSGLLCGAQIRYLVESSLHGPIGAMAFTSAAFALKARDKYIGWNEAARRANLSRVICNARLVIASSVRVANLASHVLALSLARIGDDWEERYGVRPVLVETYVDPRRFAGTCYKAANWECIGKTAGRRDGTAKRIFIRPLCEQWREELCAAPPPLSLGDRPRPEAPLHWAEEEFGAADFFDNRLKERLYVVAQDFFRSPLATIPDACGGSLARATGAYRFFKNEAVSMDVILTPHTEATIERIKEHSVVLAPQDTTTLDYNTHFQTEGLGPTNAKGGGGLGLILHDTLAFTENGTPLGVLHAHCWARDPESTGKKDPKRPIEEKESNKWLLSFRRVAEIQRLCPDTMLVSTADRESDIYELFRVADEDPQGPKLLVRADRQRLRKVKDEENHEYLWEFMNTREVDARVKIHIPRSGSQPRARDAWCDLRYTRVDLLPPKRCAADSPITLWAVYLREPEPPDGVEALEWMLLTTVPVETLEDANQRIGWYSGRWGIEVYHRTLKSGCRIRDRQLRTADRLEACIGVDMVVAWRIYYLTMLGRETPDVPCTVFFQEIEWKTLACFYTKNPVPPDEPPTISEAVAMVGKLGGHLGRKNDGPPGTQVLWKGLQRLENAVETVEIFGCLSSPPVRAP